MLILELDAFIRIIGINRRTPYSFFLGAGASISSGIPSAGTLIWEWKREIFLSNNLGLQEQFTELSLPSVRNKLQKWFDLRGGFPTISSSEEYGFYIEKCYPLPGSRRLFFEEIVRTSRPYIGYNLLCLLAENDLVRSVWTTNFDGLVARAASNFHISPFEVGIDSQDRLPFEPQKGQLLCVSLHGDYRYDSLKNTPIELQEQEKKIRASFVSHLGNNNPLIVCGYSGRDNSIMEMFIEAYSSPGRGPIYWCGYGDDISNDIKNLIDTARNNGHQAFYISTLGFDNLMQRLALYCLQDESLAKAKTIISQNPKEVEKVPFTVTNEKINGILKSNSFEIICPTDVFQVDLMNMPKTGVWSWAEKITAGQNICAVPFKGKLLCFGRPEEIETALQNENIREIKRIPIAEKDLSLEDGVVISLLKKALTRSIATTCGLNTDGKDTLWEDSVLETKKVDSFSCKIHSSVILFLRRIGGRVYLILKPSIEIIEENGNDIPLFTINSIKNGVLGYQHNKEFNIATEHWRSVILHETNVAEKYFSIYEFPASGFSGFVFKIRRTPLFASYTVAFEKFWFTPEPKLLPHIKQKGILLKEPALIFSNKQSTGYIKDTHPLRGLVSNRPFDFPITSTGLFPSVKVGVICPGRESTMLSSYLSRGQISQKPTKTEMDYLIDYPGFSSAYGLPLEMPQSGDSTWINCSDVNGALDDRNGSIELSRLLQSSVNSLEASNKPNVIIIFIPTRWKRYREYHTDQEDFDLHDYIKAYCVQRGISTQFIEEDTLKNGLQCRIWWWLSLAIYAKAMRTPWVVDTLDSDTAFVGLGFSVRHNHTNKNIVLGCGHIYNSHGEGLQYRLSPIQDPIWVDQNPFMSFEDARNLGETIRQLFYETAMKLPRRVVIHKQTAFRKEEREGLRTGLGGINDIEMLEVNFDSALRYVASVRRQNGHFDEDNFPVKRGTIVQLDDYSFLLWVHGSTDSIQRGFRYFKGKRRIPTPIRITRYSGNSDINVVGNEILALSKMNWNSADMYSQLPATIESSREIARIGSLLQRFGPVSYDYRLFI